MEGIIVINKPGGMTSHDVVACVRRRFNMRRVGHAGTLDPMATGVLIILLGKCTKLFDRFMDYDKAYRATMRLGTKTDSADTQGKVIGEASYAHVTEEQVNHVVPQFIGEIDQVPPMVSAVKFKGKRLYELARQGMVVEREARKVKIHKLLIERIDFPDISFYMECSKGTYVRQLAEDLAEQLKTVACISAIQRTAVGPYTLDQAVDLEQLNENHLRPGPA